MSMQENQINAYTLTPNVNFPAEGNRQKRR